jgi:acyl-CoA dehydrogenase
MDMSFKPEDLEFRDEVRAWIRDAMPAALEAKAAHGIPASHEETRQWHRLLHDKGWAAPHWPQEHGGTGWDVTRRFLFQEEMVRANAPRLSPFGLGMVGPLLIQYGDDEQKRRFLPPILSGDELWCQGYSEPNAGSDLASLKLRADRDGDHYVLNGQKTWTSAAQYADWIFLLARTGSTGKKQEGISFLLADLKNTPGITIKPFLTLGGTPAFSDTYFDGARVPVQNRVGPEGGGWTMAKALLGHERTGIGGVGESARWLKLVEQIARATPLGRGTLWDDQQLRLRLARLELRHRALTMANYRTLAAAQLGRAPRTRELDPQARRDRAAAAHHRARDGHARPRRAGLVRRARRRPRRERALARERVLLPARVHHLRRHQRDPAQHHRQEHPPAPRHLRGFAVMNFDLSKEQRMIRDAVAAFVRDESPVERFRRQRETDRGWDPDTWRQMGDYGWLAIALPEEHGGIGGTFVDVALVLEQLGRGLVPEPFIPSVVLAGSLIERRGSRAQQSQLLPALGEGKISLALAYAERQSRYDLADCLARAESADGGFRLQGEKVWVLNGHAADWIVVAARTAGDQLDAEGISLFLVPGDAPGLARTPVRGIDGQRSAFLRFDNVELGADALLGEVGNALPDLEWAIDRGAAAACAEGQGLLRELFDRTVEYLKQREQFGVKIGAFQALQHRAADMFAESSSATAP